MRSALVCALVSFSSLACTTIPKTPPYVANMGQQTCKTFAKAAIDRSTEEFMTGVALTVLGATGMAAASVMGPDTDPDAAWHERGRHIFILVPSAVVTAVGAGVIARAQRTEALADQATTALAEGKNEADRFLYFQCVSARGDWSGNHSEVARIQINMFKESLAATMVAGEGAAKAQSQAQTATSLAIDAKANSVKAAQGASEAADATRDLAAATEKVIDAMPKKDSDPSLREEAKAALAAVKGGVSPKPANSTPRPPLPPPSLQQR